MVGAHKRAAAADKNDFKTRMDNSKDREYITAMKKAALEQKLKDKKQFRADAARLNSELLGLDLGAGDDVSSESSVVMELTWERYLAFGVEGSVPSSASAPSSVSGAAPGAAAAQEVDAPPAPPPRKTSDKEKRHILKGVFGLAAAVVMEDDSRIFKNKSSMEAFLHRRLVPGEWEPNLERLDQLVRDHLDTGVTGVKGRIIIRS
jgi:hypothetical protein